jgi:drug/metabolite transporter (DMT)-like permease
VTAAEQEGFVLGWYAFLVLLAGCSYGIVSPLIKLAYQHGFNTMQVTNAQYGFAAVMLWIGALFWRKGGPIPKRQWGLLIALALAGAGTSIFYYESLNQLPASLGIVLLFQFSWMVMMMDIIVTRRWPSLTKWLGILFIFIGTLLAVGLFESSWQNISFGAVAFGLLSAVCYALTLYLSGYVDTSTSPAMRSAVVVTISAVAVMLVFHPTYLVSGAIGRGLWFWGLLVALFSQVFPMMLMLIAIPKTGGRMAGVLGSIELPVSVTASHLILAESVNWEQWIGVGLILAGIVVSELLGLRRQVLESHGS